LTPGYRRGAAANRWRKAVYRKAGYRCELCGAARVKVNAHHITAICRDSGRALDSSNGIFLCVPCHKMVHNVLGNLADDEGLRRIEEWRASVDKAAFRAIRDRYLQLAMETASEERQEASARGSKRRDRRMRRKGKLPKGQAQTLADDRIVQDEALDRHGMITW